MKKQLKSHLPLYAKKLVSTFFLIIWAYTGLSSKLSLWEGLKDYGFVAPAQKMALATLLYRADIIKAPSKAGFDAAFPPAQTEAGLADSIMKLVQETQDHFVGRKAGQERWEVSPIAWMGQNEKEHLANLDTLGFVQDVPAANAAPDAICILGATRPSMKVRLDHVNALMPTGALKSQNLILLAGERYISLGQDGTPEELEPLANKLGKPLDKLTETDLLQDLYDQSQGAIKNVGCRMHLIDTPRGDLPRPTTQTSMEELLRWLGKPENHGIQRLIFVSNQPHTRYQEAVIQNILLAQGAPHGIQVIGPKVQSENPNPQAIIGALGAYIWAKSPQILEKLAPHLPQAQRDQSTALFKDNALLNKAFSAAPAPPG